MFEHVIGTNPEARNEDRLTYGDEISYDLALEQAGISKFSRV